MDEILKSLEMQIRATKKQIARENRELEDMSASLNNELTGFSIKNTVEFMKVNMDHLVEASAKLAQLEETYSMLMYEKKHEQIDKSQRKLVYFFAIFLIKILTI